VLAHGPASREIDGLIFGIVERRCVTLQDVFFVDASLSERLAGVGTPQSGGIAMLDGLMSSPPLLIQRLRVAQDRPDETAAAMHH